MTEHYRARAPLRIGIAGGGTDVDPYASKKGGCVLNTTINKYAYCTITPRDDCNMHVHSSYYGVYEAPLDGGPLKLDGNMDLIKAVTNHFGVKDGFDVLIESDAPAGSGLGGSSAMIVAMISAMSNLLGNKMYHDDIAKLAYRLEREVIGLKGGKQDQYAAAYGGFNLMEIDSRGVMVQKVDIDKDVSDELQYRSLLCYTGTSRESANIINSQIESFNRGENEKALDESKRLAKEMGKALMDGDIEEAGALLHESWGYKKQFSEKISNETINNLYDIAIRSGAIGGKVSGAGGGGFMYYICKDNKRAEVAQELQKHGVIITDFMFEPNGVTSWRTRNE
ncbi:MAG: kinase [Candidatus Methanoplasma sp.]|jgi:D-glycero-alpha-D-manno-heptose-7-phosphate kinase|nr:kinase [Candidatus Methanoplasma sp.]